MPIRRSQKKRNAEPRQKQNHRRLVIDTMVKPGSSAHRHQARSKADPARPHHRMVTLAQSSPGDRSACAPQSKTATVMLRQPKKNEPGFHVIRRRYLRSLSDSDWQSAGYVYKLCIQNERQPGWIMEIRTFDRSQDVSKLEGCNTRSIEYRWDLFTKELQSIPRGGEVLDFGAGSLRDSFELNK